MRTLIALVTVIFLAASLSNAELPPPEGADKVPCSLVVQALREYQKVKAAGTRRDVAKYFVPDGGMQFPAKTRYVYSKCDYLHLDVEFDLLKPEDVSSLPDDKVISVSRLYVEYPDKD